MSARSVGNIFALNACRKNKFLLFQGEQGVAIKQSLQPRRGSWKNWIAWAARIGNVKSHIGKNRRTISKNFFERTSLNKIKPPFGTAFFFRAKLKRGSAGSGVMRLFPICQCFDPGQPRHPSQLRTLQTEATTLHSASAKTARGSNLTHLQHIDRRGQKERSR